MRRREPAGRDESLSELAELANHGLFPRRSNQSPHQWTQGSCETVYCAVPAGRAWEGWRKTVFYGWWGTCSHLKAVPGLRSLKVGSLGLSLPSRLHSSIFPPSVDILTGLLGKIRRSLCRGGAAARWCIHPPRAALSPPAERENFSLRPVFVTLIQEAPAAERAGV